jgi:hypothetical protein
LAAKKKQKVDEEHAFLIELSEKSIAAQKKVLEEVAASQAEAFAQTQADHDRRMEVAAMRCCYKDLLLKYDDKSAADAAFFNIYGIEYSSVH